MVLSRLFQLMVPHTLLFQNFQRSNYHVTTQVSHFVGKKDFIHIFIHCRQVNLNYFISLLIDRLLHNNFGVFYNNTLNYLFTNPERDVVKHNIDNPLDVPRHLPNTRIPNQHTSSVITGVHVGHYFWIFGGFKIQQHGPKVSLSSL
jgi:hypothetical protein